MREGANAACWVTYEKINVAMLQLPGRKTVYPPMIMKVEVIARA